MDRVTLSAETYDELFGAPPDPGAGPDPESTAILRHVIFARCSTSVGRTTVRATIAVVVLATNETLP